MLINIRSSSTRFLLFVLILINYNSHSICNCLVVSQVLDIIKIGADVLIGLSKAWDLVDQNVDFADVPIPILHKTENKLFGRIDRINMKLEQLSAKVDKIGTQSITTIIHNLPERVRLELRLNDLIDYLTRIEANYRRMQTYTINQKDYERLTLEDFAQTIVSHDSSSVINLIERIHTFIVPNGRSITSSGLFELLANGLEFVIIPTVFSVACISSCRTNNLAFNQNTKPDYGTYGMESLNSNWEMVIDDIRSIEALYKSFRRFERQQTTSGRIPSPKQAWIDFTEPIIGAELVTSIRKINDDTLFESASKEVESNLACDLKQSAQQVLYNLYDSIALAELKGYSMVQFSYMLLKLHGKGNFTIESQNSRQRYKERMKDATDTVRKVLNNVKRTLWNCDPKTHVKGETYEEITNFLQGYIQNEVDLNADGTCKENCAEYTYTKSYGCYDNQFCKKQRKCNGKIIGCHFHDSDMWICNADPSTNRRYNYIEYENGKVLGRKIGCPRGTTKVDSWWRWLFWHCSYCFCYCDEETSASDRYVNMRPAVADIENNRIVTGLRFVKNNRIIHLQIQEGELLPRLNINMSTVTWKPVENYKITDRSIFNSQDYHKFTWEKRALDLDDLEADDGYILTGVRFKEIGSHLNFEIYTTKFDFDSGKLKTEQSKWKDNPNTDVSKYHPRKELQLIQPDVPTRSLSQSIPTSVSDQYIEFTHTDIYRDAGQTAVPFFDAQKVESYQAVPLSGAGIFHKGRPYFGGFVTPKIITYDVSKYLHAAFPNEDLLVN